MSDEFVKHHVHIGIPSHNASICAGTAQTVMDALRLSRHHITSEIIGLSLLARCFNSLWKSAYDRGAKYFFLLHSDVQLALPPDTQPFNNATVTFETDPPNNCWLDLMIHQMQTYKLAALSVPSLIKSDAGLLSSGMDLYPGNYHSLRRMTLAQLQACEYPVILRNDACKVMGFDRATAGAYLINSAALLMDLESNWFNRDNPWPGFGIEDVLLMNTKGELGLCSNTEDWKLSRWMWENDMPYAMTKSVLLLHFGMKSYNNWEVWGKQTDDGPMELSPEEFRRT